MKNIILSLFTLFFITSCDAPQRNRVLTGGYGNGLSYTGTEGTNSGATNGNTAGTTTSGTSTGGTTGSTTLPPDFASCNTSTDLFYAAGIGKTSLCQSSTNETSVRVMFTTTDNELGTCMIPTYKAASGSSMYLGQPQCTFHTANQVIYGSIPKTRVGYTSYALNGVMVMKRSALNDYFGCMDGYAIYGTPSYPVSGCPYGAATSAACAQGATNYMNQKCTTFKNVYNSQYMDIRLKN